MMFENELLVIDLKLPKSRSLCELSSGVKSSNVLVSSIAQSLIRQGANVCSRRDASSG